MGRRRGRARVPRALAWVFAVYLLPHACPRWPSQSLTPTRPLLRLIHSPRRFTMLPPFIIEQIRRREEQERARPEQPQLEIPANRGPAKPAPASEDKDERGVVVI